jgi:hypothetical protein
MTVFGKQESSKYISVTRNLETVDAEMVPETGTAFLAERLVFDVVVITVDSDQLSIPEGIDNTLCLGRTQKLDGKLIDGDLKRRGRSSNVSVGFDESVPGRHDPDLLFMR